MEIFYYGYKSHINVQPHMKYYLGAAKTVVIGGKNVTFWKFDENIIFRFIFVKLILGDRLLLGIFWAFLPPVTTVFAAPRKYFICGDTLI